MRIFGTIATLAIAFVFASCGWFGQKKQAVDSDATAGNIETAIAGTTGYGYSGPPATEDLDLDNRRVLYCVWEKNGGYHISKRDGMFIVDNKLVIVDIPHEPFNYAIKRIEYQGDSVITAVLDNLVLEWKYFGDLLKGEKLHWMAVERDEDEQIMTMVKDPETLIWSVNGVNGSLFIDTYDIIPSGHYYQNQTTTRHDPDNENFLPVEWVAPTGVFDLDETPRTIAVDSDEYREMEKPFEGKWLELTMTDIGYVVYDYPELDEGKTHSPDFIEVKNNTVTRMYAHGELATNPFDEIMVWSEDASYYMPCNSFKWIDRERHIAVWTDYYPSEKRTVNQGVYIKEEFNTYPVVMFDWE